MFIRLKDHVVIEKDTNYYYFLTRTILKIEKFPYIDEMIHLLINGVDTNIFEQKFVENTKSNNGTFLLEQLNNLGLLTSFSTEDHSITSRQLYYLNEFDVDPTKLQNKLDSSHIVIFGLGGIGSCVLQQLLRVGIRKYTLIDFDVVEKSNLNRQLLYTPTDIGKRKTDVCKEIITSFYPIDNYVHEINKKIIDETDIQNCLYESTIDFVLIAIDQPNSIIQEISKFCLEKSIPSIFGGLGIDFGIFQLEIGRAHV